MAAVACIAAANAAAQFLSDRPITIIIPFTPGASSDSFQRLVAKKVTENTGQPFIVESRPGGGGAVGAVVARQAPPDGYTLFQANNGTHAANVSLYTGLPYDPVKDFAPITLMWSFPQLLVVPVTSPVKSVAELVALAKAKPGGLSFGSQGSGSSGHILGEMLRAGTGAPMVHVPYRGAAPASLDVASGHIDFLFVSYASVLPFVQSAKVRVLAVTSAKRLTALPDVETMAEVGFPGYQLDAWFGLVAPAGTPKPIIDKLHAAFVAAVRDKQVAKQIEDQGAEAVSDTPAEFAAFIAAETERFAKIVKALGIKAE
jgi:tripartite-type tricarboxylate transporter receptor subunit TctC